MRSGIISRCDHGRGAAAGAVVGRRGARRSKRRCSCATPATARTASRRTRRSPIIWGQHQGYTYLQLRDYKRGDRKNDQMSPVAEALERDEMMALAEYFANKPWPDLRQPSAPDAVRARAQRANVAVGCTGCHLGEYQGAGTQPRLAGQTKDYLARSMLDFRTGARGNNPGHDHPDDGHLGRGHRGARANTWRGCEASPG